MTYVSTAFSWESTRSLCKHPNNKFQSVFFGNILSPQWLKIEFLQKEHTWVRAGSVWHQTHWCSICPPFRKTCHPERKFWDPCATKGALRNNTYVISCAWIMMNVTTEIPIHLPRRGTQRNNTYVASCAWTTNSVLSRTSSLYHWNQTNHYQSVTKTNLWILNHCERVQKLESWCLNLPSWPCNKNYGHFIPSSTGYECTNLIVVTASAISNTFFWHEGDHKKTRSGTRCLARGKAPKNTACGTECTKKTCFCARRKAKKNDLKRATRRAAPYSGKGEQCTKESAKKHDFWHEGSYQKTDFVHEGEQKKTRPRGRFLQDGKQRKTRFCARRKTLKTIFTQCFCLLQLLGRTHILIFKPEKHPWRLYEVPRHAMTRVKRKPNDLKTQTVENYMTVCRTGANANYSCEIDHTYSATYFFQNRSYNYSCDTSHKYRYISYYNYSYS